MKQAQADKDILCYHCGDPCNKVPVRSGALPFCCEGCKMVYELLQQNELCTYYDLNKTPGVAQASRIRAGKFSFLDNEDIARKLISFTDGQQTNVSFYLPQMHCSSCLWLLEHSHRMHKGIISARVNFARKEVLITYSNKDCSLRQVAETLAAIGYEPHINLNDIGQARPKVSNKSRLYRIGIAGFCFSNIMIMSLPEYFASGGSVEGAISNTFRLLSVLLSLPVLFYCAAPFFVTAWKGIRNGFLNIDMPIALAIGITFCRSLYELISGTGSGYLDSMTGIVFFMLLGRLLQDRTYQFISFDRDFKSFFPVAVDTKRGADFVPVMIEQLKPDDVIRIHAHELIPADALLSKGRASIDYSFVSGESIPVQAAVGEIVYAGGKQLDGSLELVVIKEVSQSYLTHLWNKEAFKESKQQVSFIDTISKYFTLAVLLIAVAAAGYWWLQDQPQLLWNALTTVLIVACPCALLLSATFTNGNILRILGKHQLYLRHPDVIEDLARTDHVVFDKTGTLTQSKEQEVTYEGTALSDADKKILAALLVQSTHPLSQAVYHYLDIPVPEGAPPCKEVPGQGIEGWIDERHVKAGGEMFVRGQLGNSSNRQGAEVFVCIDEKIPGKFIIRNSYRSGFNDVMQVLGRRFKCAVLSGDNDTEAAFLEERLGPDTQLLFRQRPEDKLRFIKDLQEREQAHVLMVGDGLNDAGALKQSNTGIAITEGIHNFTPASDGIMDASQFRNLARFIAFAKSGRHIIIGSFLLSVVYNIIGLYFALQGTLSPVIAAILMPASSVSIILATYGMSEWAARYHKLS